jgi:hypothetical protein
VIDEMIYNGKNIVIQEFQHSVESELIEVMNVKMLQIQFVSRVNLISTLFGIMIDLSDDL